MLTVKKHAQFASKRFYGRRRIIIKVYNVFCTNPFCFHASYFAFIFVTERRSVMIKLILTSQNDILFCGQPPNGKF